MELLEAIRHAIDGNAVLFVGSGFSCSALNLAGQPLKTGVQLAGFLSDECGLAGSATLEDAADFYLAKHGPTRLVTLLTNQFQVATLGPEHPTFGRIPWKRIYTTNYDNTIEQAYKANKRPIVPISLDDSIRRVRDSATQCVHINGFVDALSEESLFTTFKLTDTSYSSSNFRDSPWAGQFRHDISAASAVIFVGYSAYDLDIKRLLLQTPECFKKTLFVVGNKPDEVIRYKLAKFGQVVDGDTARVSREIFATLTSYAPREHTIVFGRYVVPIGPPKFVSTPRDRDVLDLLLWGRLDRALVWSSVAGSSTAPYICIRDTVSLCLQMLEDGERDIVVRSDLGNGKTALLECLAVMAAQFGYTVVYLGTQGGADSVAEVEAAAHCDVKTLLLVDSYTTRRPEVEAIAHHRSAQLRVVYSARTLRHDVSFDWLHATLGVDSIAELDLDHLTDGDRRWFCNMLDTYGLWGSRADWSQDRKLRFIQRECEGRVSSILLAILDSPTIVERLTHVVEAILSVNRTHLEAVAGILALSVIEIDTNLELLANLIGPEVLNRAAFRNNEAIRTIFDFESDRIVARSAVVGRHLLTSSVDPEISVSALGMMAANADKLSGSDLYFQILRELMRFTNLQSILPARHKMNAVLVYYERLKNLGACRTNPNFWLQYAIATLALESFTDARIKLETAYAHAKKRPGYDTFMIDNTAARLELEELAAAPSQDRLIAMAGFRKARAIVNRQVTQLEFRHYPFRVAAKYGALFSTHRSVLTPEDREELARAARFVLRRIRKLTPYQASHRYVVECREALGAIAEEIPLAET